MFDRFIRISFKTIISTALILIAIAVAGCGKSEPSTAESAVKSAATAVSEAIAGDDNFEGVVVMKMDTGEQKGMEMTFSLKGTKTRVETGMPGTPEVQGIMIMDTDAGKMMTLMPQQKMYMTMDLKGMAEEAGEKSAEVEKFPKLTSTGRRETIAGHECEHWLIGDKQDIDMCVAKGLGYFGMGGQSGEGSFRNMIFSPKMLAEAAAHPEWVKLLKGGAFPLKITATENGKAAMTMEATRVEKKSLDDTLFGVPAGYKEFNMQDMMRGRR